MAWDVEYTDEFGDWWDTLGNHAKAEITASVDLLAERGPTLAFPHSSGIATSRHSHMRELRTQVGGKPYRTFYAFDPVRAAILLIGGDKTGDDRFYERLVPVADDLYDIHLKELAKEGLI